MAIDLGKYKLTPEQIQEKINLGRYRLKPEIDIEEQQRIQQRGEKAEEFLKKPWYKQLLPSKFAPPAKEVMREVLAEPAQKFVKSAIETPETILRRGETPETTRETLKSLPIVRSLLKPKSFIEEQEERVPEIIEGKRPLYTGLAPFAEVPLAGLEVFGYAKGIQKLSPKAWNIMKPIVMREAKKFGNIIDIVSNPITKKEATQAITRAGRPGGVKTTGFLRKKPVIEPTKYDIETAETVKPFYNKNPFRFAEKINDGIEESAKGVKSFLQKNKVDYVPDELIAKIDDVKPPLLITPENTIAVQRAKDIAKDVILSTKNDNVSLWEARKLFDQTLESAKAGILDPDRIASINLAVRQIRKTINNHIATITKGGEKFTSEMKRMSNMYNALDEIAAKNATLLNRILKESPLLSRILRRTTRIMGGAAIGAAAGIATYRLLGRK